MVDLTCWAAGLILHYTQHVLLGTSYKGQSKILRKFKKQGIWSLSQSRDTVLLFIKGPYAELQIQGTEIQSQLKVSIFPIDKLHY